MMYKALRQWRDLTDDHLYSAGDAYPHDGREIEPARIAELTGNQNNARMALIEAVKDAKKPEKNTEIEPVKAAKSRTRRK